MGIFFLLGDVSFFDDEVQYDQFGTLCHILIDHVRSSRVIFFLMANYAII